MVKTIVEEPETQTSTQAVSQGKRSWERAGNAVIKQNQPARTSAVARPEADCYESCLDLSALFLPRG